MTASEFRKKKWMQELQHRSHRTLLRITPTTGDIARQRILQELLSFPAANFLPQDSKVRCYRAFGMTLPPSRRTQRASNSCRGATRPGTIVSRWRVVRDTTASWSAHKVRA